jgi:alanine dehydrogenase
MLIGIPKEIKVREYRVGLIPGGVKLLTDAGHKVLVEKGAGEGSGLSDKQYIEAGATIVSSADEVWGQAEMIMKVKEPIPVEFPRMRENQLVYTYFHIAADPELAHELVKRKVTAVAYETIELPDGTLPLLKPMSAVAGRMAVQVGAAHLQKESGGKGILLGGVPGVERGKVVIIGAGVVGTNAAKMAMGLGAQVTIMDIHIDRLEYLDDVFFGKIITQVSNPHTIAEAVKKADLVVGAVLVAGAKAPHLVTRAMIASMEPGSVVVDVSVDQGGCIETCHPTTHDDPTYVVDGVVHYCVANMPGAVARTSTFALNNATIPYGLKLANLGFRKAIEADTALAKGVNAVNGHCTFKAVAEAVKLPFTPLDKAL